MEKQKPEATSGRAAWEIPKGIQTLTSRKKEIHKTGLCESRDAYRDLIEKPRREFLLKKIREKGLVIPRKEHQPFMERNAAFTCLPPIWNGLSQFVTWP